MKLMKVDRHNLEDLDGQKMPQEEMKLNPHQGGYPTKTMRIGEQK